MKSKKNIQHVDLKSIQNPSFLKGMKYKELDVLSADIRKEIIQSTSKNGGHLSSNLGVVESTIALCRTLDLEKDKLIFDVGHQSYAYKLLTGRSLERLRQKDGVSGFQRMSESKYDHYEAGHSSTSIAAVNGMAITRDLKGENYNVVAFIGDSSIANGLAAEALNDVGMQKHKIIVILNDNDMSISQPVGGLSRSFRRLSTSSAYQKFKSGFKKIFDWNPVGRWLIRVFGAIKNWFKTHLFRMNMFDTLNLAYIGPVDGHNIKALEKAIERAKSQKKSTVVHIKTIKGKGYKPAEKDISGHWHGVGPFDIESGKQLSDCKNQWGKIYSNLLLEEMKQNDKIVVVVPGTSYGSYIDQIHKEFPKRTIDVGIAEEYAITFSSGISVNGYHPVISMYSTFLQRAYDELSHDIARMNLNATLLIDRAGLVGADGTTHQGIFDESFLYTIPNTVICMASNPNQCKSLLRESFNNHGLFCIRFSKDVTSDFSQEETVEFGKWKTELSSGKSAIVSVGPETEALKDLLEGKNVRLYNAIYQKPLDMDKVKELLSLDKVVIFDAYSTRYGFANSLASTLSELGYKGEVIIKTVPEAFIHHASVKEQLADLKLRPEDIIKEVA